MPRGPHWFHRRIRGYGCRLTLPRQRILEVLSRSSKHLSAEEIYHRVHQVYPAIGLTTVYRTLELLVNTGILTKHEFGEGRARYEYMENSQKEHAHLICSNCGIVIDCSDIDIEKFGLDKILKEVSTHYDFEVKRKRLVFHGLCKECVKEGKK